MYIYIKEIEVIVLTVWGSILTQRILILPLIISCWILIILKMDPVTAGAAAKAKIAAGKIVANKYLKHKYGPVVAGICAGCLIAGGLYGSVYGTVHEENPYIVWKDRLALQEFGQHYIPKLKREPFFTRLPQYSNQWLPIPSITNGFAEDGIDSGVRNLFGTPKLEDPLRCLLISNATSEEIDNLILRRKRELNIDLGDPNCPKFIITPNEKGIYDSNEIRKQWDKFHNESLPNYKMKLDNCQYEKHLAKYIDPKWKNKKDVVVGHAIEQIIIKK